MFLTVKQDIKSVLKNLSKYTRSVSFLGVAKSALI